MEGLFFCVIILLGIWLYKKKNAAHRRVSTIRAFFDEIRSVYL
jgi:hypothetical protein